LRWARGSAAWALRASSSTALHQAAAAGQLRESIAKGGFSATLLDGVTGQIRLTREQQFVRELTAAQFIEGKTIILDEQAVQTSRLMNEYGNDLQYQGDGETYMDEWVARGHTESGEKMRVYWHFEIAREDVEKEGAYANDTEAENYDWDDVHCVKSDE